ncbi:hypothetical protein [Streptomyces sp. TRM70350]|uniref:rhamnogalacturonan lyase family protein n=1 Tax=Streptomyces sp. TRM70350 TaxID=2856165 RepID=UPI0035A8F498
MTTSRCAFHSTPIQTTRRLYTLVHDPRCRVVTARQNTAFSQPPNPGLLLGDGMSTLPQPDVHVR